MHREPILIRAVLACLAIACLAGSADATDKYFRLHDMAHGCYLAAGASYDGDTYHLRENELGDHASWRFLDAGDGYYYLVDRRHGAGLCGGDTYDGDVYALTNYGTRDNARWRAVPGQTWGTVILYDKKHNKAVIGGNTYDHRIYHQDPGTRLNAEWVLTMVADGDSGPDFYVAGQELLSLEMHSDLADRLNRPPLFVIDGEKVTNNTGVTQQMTITKSKTETVIETWSFSETITWGVSQTFEVSGSVEGVVDLKSSTTFSFSKTNGWTKGGQASTEHQMTWEIPVSVPPYRVVQVDGIVEKYEATVPFTALINTVLGSGRSRVDTVEGTWKGVELVTGEITFTDVTGIRYPRRVTPMPDLGAGLPVTVYRVDGNRLGRFPEAMGVPALPMDIAPGIYLILPEDGNHRTVPRKIAVW